MRLVHFKSKKAKLFWNNRDITHLFRDANKKLERVTFAWQARSGEIFQVVARSPDSSLPKGRSQFEFYIDGISFAQLPLPSDLGTETSGQEIPLVPSTRSNEDRQDYAGPLHSRSLSSLGNGSSPVSVDPPETPREPQHLPGNLDFRLAMVGLSPSTDEVVDELQSDLYSSTIDTLRTRITECIPQTEEMVSRAIMNAFFSDDDSLQSQESFSEDSTEHFFEHSMQLEADAVVQAYEWVNQSGRGIPDVTERLDFLQKQIDSVMAEIRRGRLSAGDACQHLISVACVLGLEVNPTSENTTILLVGLDPRATEEDLSAKLKVYGEIATASASETAGYGLCRYCYPASVGLATEASARAEIVIQGRTTQALSLSTVASVSAKSLESRSSPLQQEALSFDDPDDDFSFGSQCDGSLGQMSPIRDVVTATFVMQPEKSGCLDDGTMEQLMIKSPDACSNNRDRSTVSTLDSDSETGLYGSVRYE